MDTITTSQSTAQEKARTHQQQHYYSVSINGSVYYSHMISSLADYMALHCDSNDVLLLATYRTSTGRAIW